MFTNSPEYRALVESVRGSLAEAVTVATFAQPNVFPLYFYTDCRLCGEPLSMRYLVSFPLCGNGYCKHDYEEWDYADCYRTDEYCGCSQCIDRNLSDQEEAWADYLYAEYAAEIAACDPYGDFWDIGPGWRGRIAA
jgi:hypothetical protein